MSRTWLRGPKQGPPWTRKCLTRLIWRTFFHANRGLFHTTDMASKCFISSAQVAFWIWILMVRAFQTGNDSCTALMCLQYVIKYQNHPDASQFHISLMYFPIYFNTFGPSILPRIPLIPITSCSVGSPGPSQGSWGTPQTSDFLRYLLNPLRPFSFHKPPAVRLGTFQTGLGAWADMVFYSSRSYNRQR